MVSVVSLHPQPLINYADSLAGNMLSVQSEPYCAPPTLSAPSCPTLSAPSCLHHAAPSCCPTDHRAQGGVNGVIPMGTTGECFAVTGLPVRPCCCLATLQPLSTSIDRLDACRFFWLATLMLSRVCLAASVTHRCVLRCNHCPAVPVSYWLAVLRHLSFCLADWLPC